jgi:hypothetical protein
VWRGPLVHRPPGSEVRLAVPRALLTDGEYRVRIVPGVGGPPLAESILEITSSN